MKRAYKTRNKPLSSKLSLTDEEIIELERMVNKEPLGVFLEYLGWVISKRPDGKAEVSRLTGLGREGLYKSLTREGNPRLSTINTIMRSLGIKIILKDPNGTNYTKSSR